MRLVQVGFLCNNACVFCAQGRLRDVIPSPSLDVLIASVEAAAADDVVAFVGGEPTLLDVLPELVRRAREGGAEHVLVQTNGRRLAVPGYARKLADCGVTRLEVALQGSSAAMQDYHTGVPGSFKATVTGLRRARGAGLGFVLTTVVTRSNFRHLPEIVRVAHALGARGLALAPVTPAGRAVGRRVGAPRELLQPHIRQARGLAQVLGVALTDWQSSAPERSFDGWLAGVGVTESAQATENSSEPVSPAPVVSLERVLRSSVGHGLRPSSAMR